jgi:class 3 adenylate cyclase/TolB-like protein/tetratricopeptide (TPR) repeat protein
MAAPRAVRRLAAIMAVDVVGYSRLIGADEAGTLARVKAHRVELAEPLIAEHHGRVVKLTGDGALIEFGSAVDAVECAVAIQRGVAGREAAEPEARRIRYRIGINIGDIVLEDGDIFGDGVNVAARLEGLAKPGEICVARNVHDQVKAKLDFGFEPLGEHRVKNIAEPITVYRVLPGSRRPTVGTEATLWQARFWPVAAAASLALLVGGALAWLRPWHAADQPPGAPTSVVAASAPALDPHRVAVLPFTNISAEAKDEWFADGITEEMITRLSQIPELRVIARTSIVGYKGTSKGVAEIGRELGAGTILEGSVRRAGDQVRVTAQLVDSGSQAHLWSASYDRPMREIFVVQSDVAQKVAEALRITLLTDVKRRVDRRGTKDTVAFELYLKARRNFNEYTPQSMLQAITDYQAAIERDPSYADAYVGLGEAWTDGYWVLTTSGRQAIANATAAADHALTLDSDIAGAHAVLATAKMYAWDWQGAEAGFKRALELNPSSVSALLNYNWAYLTQIRGRYDEALAGMRRANELDPLYTAAGDSLGWILFHASRYDASIEWLKGVVERNSNFVWSYLGLGANYMALRRYDEAVRWHEKAVEVSGGYWAAKSRLGWAYGRAGRTEEAHAILDELKIRYPQEKFSPMAFVMVYQGLGDLDNAFQWLEHGYEDQDFLLLFLQGHEFDDLRGDPRYAAMKAKIGFPPRG